MLRLLEDERVGGVTRYQLTEAEALVQIPDEIRKCVGFIGVDVNGSPTVNGTFFLLSMPVFEDQIMVYAVTAAHVLEGIRGISADGQALLRMNSREGKVAWISHALDLWHVHPDPAADIAVISLALHVHPLDYKTFPTTAMATDEIISREGIGIGDEVFLPGLFYRHYGAERNIPIVRAGNIAAMPEEPVSTGRGLTPAYLIECRSIGGLSGSPVFVYLGPMRSGTIRTGPRFFLIGLMHGHWDVIPSGLTDAVSADGLREEVVNMGIGIVIPAARIVEALNLPALQEERDREKAAFVASKAPTPDSSSESPQPS